MSLRTFLEGETRQRAAHVICDIESETSVEVVVSVSKAAKSYWRTDVAFGAAVALIVLAILLLSPTPYWAPLIPLDTLLAFGLGTLLCRHVPPLRRALLGQRRLQANVQAAARRAFERQGIDKTRDRSGLLVFVSLFERRVELLTDVGIDTSLLSESYTEQLGKLQQGVQTLDSEQFLSALGALKRPLAQVYPRRHDDLNELSNEVV